MPIYDDISAQLKEAMKARDKPRVSALRGVRAAFIEEIKKNAAETISDEDALTIIGRLAKQRKESIVAYEKGGRDDLVAAEQADLDVIEAFLPAKADEAQTRAWIEEAIEATGASSMRDMGKVMGKVLGAHKAEVDGKLASDIVKKLLA